MASINHAPAGYNPPPLQKVVKKAPRKVSKKVSRVDTCECCGITRRVPISTKDKVKIHQTEEGAMCFGCASHFDLLTIAVFSQRNPRWLTPVQSKEKIDRLKESKFGLMLETRKFFSEPSGNILGIDFGDIVRLHRISLPENTEPTGDRTHTKIMHSVDIRIGGETITLFPYEVFPISWIDIMALKKDGDYTESFVCPDDPEGFFSPSEKMKQQLIVTFGNR